MYSRVASLFSGSSAQANAAATHTAAATRSRCTIPHFIVSRRM
jgi:hypothetical protein